MLESQICRNLFVECGLTYSDIGSKEIGKLIGLIKISLEPCTENSVKMTLDKLKKNDYNYLEDGSIECCFLKVSSDYFKGREAISFNKDGFIGFAGWASSNNEKPITDAFKKWCLILKNKKLYV